MNTADRYSTYPESRVIPFEGSRNFRDLGGYLTEDGRRVKYGLFFRSDELSELTEKDLAFLRTLPIKFILDYRDDGEAELKPGPQLEGVSYERVPASNGSFQVQQGAGSIEELLRSGMLQQMDPAMMPGFYAKMTLNNPSYRRLMEVIQDPANLGLLHHCTAGKDRTGVGSALILLALGVPKDTILEDYLLTNELMAGFREFVISRVSPFLKGEELEKLSLLLEARQEFMEAVFETIETVYGDTGSFLAEEFGLTMEKRERLQAYCLE